MSPTNENRQTFKQYTARKKRLIIQKEFGNQKNSKKNEIIDLDKQILKLSEQKKKKEKELNEIDDQEFKKFANIFNNKELLNEMFHLGANTRFPTSILNDLENACINGIKDDINNVSDVIKKLCELDSQIFDEVSHTNCAGDILDKLGSLISLPEKEVDDNNGD